MTLEYCRWATCSKICWEHGLLGGALSMTLGLEYCRLATCSKICWEPGTWIVWRGFAYDLGFGVL